MQQLQHAEMCRVSEYTCEYLGCDNIHLIQDVRTSIGGSWSMLLCVCVCVCVCVWSMRMCVCVCVCVCERESVLEEDRTQHQHHSVVWKGCENRYVIPVEHIGCQNLCSIHDSFVCRV